MEIITASDGHMLTDGKGTYSEKVFLGKLQTAADWKEVTKEEAEAAMREVEEADGINAEAAAEETNN